MKYNAANLKKLEDILKILNYTIRSGKGSFNTGYCVLAEKRVIVINNFHSQEAKINALAEIILQVVTDPDTLDTEQRQIYDQCKSIITV